MAPVQSRLVLAVTIPAAAIAIFLSLFWLRRASKGHPPSPPDIPIKKETDNTTKCEESSTDVKKGIGQELTESSNCKSAKLTSTADSPKYTKTDLSGEIQLFEKVGSGDRICQTSLQSSCKEEIVAISEGKENVAGDCKNIDGPRAIKSLSKIDTSVTDKQETLVVTGEKTSSKDIESNYAVSSCHIERPVVDEQISFVLEKVNDSEPPEETLIHSSKPDPDDKSDCKISADEMIAEETSSPVKLGYEKEAEMVKSDLAEKLANLELDTMKMGDVDVKERDSANHSPSENMLASPSMSNFSDAHSEGSSDSGKGHSDGTTSPSRTPAGGSSVSGEPSPSIYEFVIPQIIVGRLIGRHGVFLHEIMSATHTNIFIKVHPETIKLKICAIEGSQQDIEKALEMIRKKFPVRRYPKLTLEQVSFVQLQHSQQLKSEDFHLQLIEGVNNDVILSSLLNPGQFFVQQPCHPSYPCLTPLTQTLTQVYSATNPPALVSPVPDAICICPSLGGWYRAQIVGVDEDSRQCDLKFVDYGGYLRVDATLLKQIRADFLTLPFQAVECSLANIKAIHESGWSEEARLFVHNITFGRILQAQIMSYTDSGIPLVNLYSSINAQVVLVNAELVTNGFAVYTAQSALQLEEEEESLPDQHAV